MSHIHRHLRGGWRTYGKLAEGERHVLLVAADLHEDSSVLAELARDSSLEGLIILGLGEA